MAIRYNKKTEQLVFTGKEALALDQACKELGKSPDEVMELAIRELINRGESFVEALAKEKKSTKKRRK